MTSHAAVVARGMGKCCVAGCGAISIDYKAEQFTVGDKLVKKGDFITLDGSNGLVILGDVPTVEPTLGGDFEVLMSWADKFRRLGVRTNADTPKDSAKAREFGAEGIGLTRTEHMFFGEDRVPHMQKMILAKDEASRRKALEKLLPMQRDDFEGIFEAMDGLPVTIRLLDPPLHEFLPSKAEEIEELARDMGIDAAELEKKVESLKEFNPMLGHRGCRLGITYPEIYEMQAQAIFEAACNASQRGIKVIPEIMIPLVGEVKELAILKKMVNEVGERVMEEKKRKVKYLVGTMIEIPRAALLADEVAEEAEFFSYGTNDLTQMTYGYSRDDSGVFLADYISKGVLETDPFQVMDQKGVGMLVEMGTKKGRKTRPKLKVGICGEHGGEPKSVKFCHRAGLDYVSCSPYRVPIARLAAAHAALEKK
jgi:pyruvate,orthophosphate dikinase